MDEREKLERDGKNILICQHAINHMVALHGHEAEEMGIQMKIDGQFIEARWKRKEEPDA